MTPFDILKQKFPELSDDILWGYLQCPDYHEFVDYCDENCIKREQIKEALEKLYHLEADLADSFLARYLG